jgi:PAS domain-containing protein
MLRLHAAAQVEHRGLLDGADVRVDTTAPADLAASTPTAGTGQLFIDGFKSLFDCLPVGAYRFLPVGNQLRANPALARLNGWDNASEMLGSVPDIARELLPQEARCADFLNAELIAAGLRRFHGLYQLLFNAWGLYDNSGSVPLMRCCSLDHGHGAC